MADQTPNLDAVSTAPATTTGTESVAPVQTSGVETSSQKYDLTENWYQGLPEDIRDEPSLKSFKDISGLAKSYVHAQRAIGADKVPLPSKHATADDWKKFWTKVGMPEKLDDYKVEVPQGKLSEEDAKWFKEVAYETGVLPEKAQQFLGKYLEKLDKDVANFNGSIEKRQQEWDQALKQEWGAAYEQKLEVAKRALKHIGDPALEKVLHDSGFGTNPNLIKAFTKFGEMLKEDKVVGDKPGMYSPAEASRKAQTILGNMEHPYHNSEHPNHSAAVEEMRELVGMQYPESSFPHPSGGKLKTEETFRML